ncbi:hypothetical protein FB45DRAFT_245003 [Roridomyces roridus]|uniref:Uncharacterized protein n=1 Tax=Roridomyces roridus TaxID=1738132 RepID=A0AAD7FEJ6_9AGAR|nr:hypothetical protein FB45DRAFT_245003 [Roridomyces roridus]
MKDSPGPAKLPRELEREIFKRVAVLYPEMITALLRVAQRVFEWIEPHLYTFIEISAIRTKSAHRTAILRTLDRNPPDCFTQAVRHMFFSSLENNLFSSRRTENPWSQPNLERFLRACTGVNSLLLVGFNTDPIPPVLPLVLHMRPTHLALGGNIFPSPTQPESTFHFGSAFFQHITHLQLFQIDARHKLTLAWPHWHALALLPVLTHLAVLPEDSYSFPAHILAVIRDLEVLVVWVPPAWYASGRASAMPLPRGPRLCVERAPRFMSDWLDGARGGEDIWVKAERFLQGKRRGEIEGEFEAACSELKLIFYNPESCFFFPEELPVNLDD